MTFTQSDGLRDREYDKFTPEQIGSITGVNVSNVLKTYDFGQLTCDNNGQFEVHSTREINGMLKGVVMLENSFIHTGSLTLTVSGLGIDIWQMASGTDAHVVALPTVDQSGGIIPKANARSNTGVLLSGTTETCVWEDIPMYGHYTLTGSVMRNSSSGNGFILIYR